MFTFSNDMRFIAITLLYLIIYREIVYETKEINMELQGEVDFLTLRCSCYPQCNIELNKTCHIENKFCRMVCGHWWNQWI